MSKVLIAISGNLDRQLVARLLEDEDIAYYEVTDQVLEEKFLNSAGLIIVDTIHARKYAQLISKTKNSTNYFLPVIILLPPFEKAENWLTGVFDDIIRIPTSRRELKTRLLMYL
ncbi:MAG: hypothetical protein N2662_12420, partial [Bacteroidales bacterium]|nr:hypothetical protein [Bacteroidales bacterium]